MAVPQFPLEIWAEEDYHLPNADNPNKIRPIDDLWAKGYDKGQRPDVEAWNYLWYMQTSWLQYMYSEQIPGLDDRFLQKSLNLSDIPNKAAALTNLGVYSKTESEARYVNVTGDTMTGALGTPRINFPASNTDTAWIETVSPSDDKTFFDFGISDNFGDKNNQASSVDVMRWRFTPSDGQPTFSMLELHAETASSAFMELSGKLWVRDFYSNTDAVVNGKMSSTTAGVNGLLEAGRITSYGRLIVSYGGMNSEVTNNGDVFGPVWNVSGNTSLKNYIDTRSTTSADLGQERGWFKDEKTGYITQWCVGSWRGYDDERFETVSFPIPFPNECLSVNCGTQLQAETNKADGFGEVAAWDKNGARICVQWSGQGDWNTGIRAIIWAVGR